MDTQKKSKVLILSSFFSTDRILLYSTFLNTLTQHADVEVWSNSSYDEDFPNTEPFSSCFRPFRVRQGFRHYLNILRYLNDYAWEFSRYSTTRRSIWKANRHGKVSWLRKTLRTFARIIFLLRLHKYLDKLVEVLVVRYGPSKEHIEVLRKVHPDIVLSMCPYQSSEMSILAAAKSLSIPTVTYITSWDNISTKSRLSIKDSAYLVWSEHMRDELHKFYPSTAFSRVFLTGAPQYDIFTQKRFHQSREAYFRHWNLAPDRPLIVYCLGSPNFIREDYGVLEFLRRMRQTSFSHAQVIVRLHPGFHEKGYTQIETIQREFPSIIVQGPHRYWQGDVAFQTPDSIAEWVNTLRYADVVINLSSTIAVDACVLDRPVVNLNFDPDPKREKQQLVKDINSIWNHFAPITRLNGLWMVNNYDELMQAIQTYLTTPDLHSEGRRAIVEHVCQTVDGQSGMRMAQAIIDLLNSE